MYRQAVVFNALYAGANEPVESVWRLVVSGWSAFSEATVLWLLGLAGLALLVLSRGAALSDRRQLLVLWFLADLVGVLVGGKFYLHYYLLVVPSLALLSAYTLSQIVPEVLRSWRSPVAATLAVFVLLLAIAPMGMRWARGLHSLHDPSAPRYAPELLDTVASLTNRDDYIQIWGAEAGLYFLTNRRSSTRYIYNYPR